MTIIIRDPQNKSRKTLPGLTFLFLLVGLNFSSSNAYAQNVGIGTSSPQKKLSVAGSVLVDQGNKNFGTLDSAALVFGTTGGTGISSRKIGSNLNDLRFWTNGQSQLTISSQGRFGIGGTPSESYRLNVYGSGLFHESVRVLGNIRTDENMAINGGIDPLYRLRVYDGNSRFGGNIHATGNAAIGGDVDPDFRFRVWGGNSRFGGNAEVTGTLNTTNLAVSGNMTIGGKGSVRSNGNTSLKIHFTSVLAQQNFDGEGDLSIYKISLPDFSSSADVRLMVSHFEVLVNDGYNPQNVVTYFSDLDPVKNEATFVVRSLVKKKFLLGGTYFITAIMKEN